MIIFKQESTEVSTHMSIMKIKPINSKKPIPSTKPPKREKTSTWAPYWDDSNEESTDDVERYDDDFDPEIDGFNYQTWNPKKKKYPYGEEDNSPIMKLKNKSFKEANEDGSLIPENGKISVINITAFRLLHAHISLTTIIPLMIETIEQTLMLLQMNLIFQCITSHQCKFLKILQKINLLLP